MTTKNISRKGFLTKTGALMVAFSFAPPLARALTASTPALASAVTDDLNQVDSWLTIAGDGTATVYCGKVELGTGVQTALSQIVSEELYLDLAQVVNFVQGDTASTPNQGYTAGSQTVQSGGVQLRQAAATAFQQLLTLGSQQLGVPSAQLVAQHGQIGVGPGMRRAISYGQLIGGRQFNLAVNTSVTLKDPNAYTIVGQSAPRVDLPDKFLARFTYVQDMVVPGMLYGRVVRPSGRNATLVSINGVAATSFPPTGFYTAPLSSGATVVAGGNFVGVVAADEWAAVQAASQLAVTWTQNNAPLAATDDGAPAARAALGGALQNPANIYDTRTLFKTGDAPLAWRGRPRRYRGPTSRRTICTPRSAPPVASPTCAMARPRSGPARRASTNYRARLPNC